MLAGLSFRELAEQQGQDYHGKILNLTFAS